MKSNKGSNFFENSSIYMFSGKDFTPAKISEIQENSPAAIAGLKVNDEIISIDGNKINSVLEVSTYINVSTKDDLLINIL